MDIDTAFLNDRRRRGVAVEFMAESGIRHFEELDVVENLARVAVDAQDEEFLAVRTGRRQPDLIAPHDWRRPALVMDGRLPDDVLFLAPGDRQAGGVGMAIAVRAVKRGQFSPAAAPAARQAERSKIRRLRMGYLKCIVDEGGLAVG